MAQRTDAARSRRVLAVAFLSRAFAYLSGLIVLALAGVGATTTGVVILAAYAARTLWSLFRALRPVRPRLADYVVDVLAPVATGLIVGHEPSSLHLLVAAQIAGAFLGLRPRVATVVGIVGAGGLAIGILGANLDRPIELTSEGYQVAETGAIWMGLTLGIIVFANLARHMWWQRRRLAETAERERTNAMLKQRFIAMVSHEFRTPLTGIRGYADLLANTRDGLSADEIGDFAATIRDQAEHLSRLVDDVLVVMRLDAGRLPLTIAAVELWPVIATLEAGILASSGRSLTIAIPPHTRVMADGDRLLQVLRNLTENAVKYGRTKVEIRAEDLNTQIRVTVSDDGPGIPEERVGDIFAEFVQLDDSGSKGFGLGLAIVTRLVDAMDGTITYEPSSLGGASFVVTLPKPDEPDSTEASQAA